MGLATQMLGWHEQFCEQLASRGRFVVRFDSRDIGLSTHLDDARVPNLPQIFAGDTSSAVYTLDDMAADTTGLIDALALESAHLVGASMGIMGQLAAIWASGERTDRLPEIAVPVTVIHGAEDPLISVSGGRATAKAIPGAELEVIEGMGHDLPRDAWPRILEAIERTVERGEQRRGS